MIQRLNPEIQELDTVILAHDIQEYHLKQGDRGAVVHRYQDGKAFEVEFVDLEGETIALLTLTHADIRKSESSNHSIHSPFQPMSDSPKVQMNFHAPVTGATGNVEGDQIIHAQTTEQNFEVLLADFQQFINDLQQKYPNATAETAIQIIDVEAKELQRTQPWRWQNLLSLKRLLNGSKTAALKVGEHFAEQNPWGKGFIGFLEGVSEDVE
jgi:hypothetical protein